MKFNAKTFRLAWLLLTVAALVGCQQRMAKQPAPRPLVESGFYSDKRASRPLEEGVIHRSQVLAHEPLASGLTPEGKKPQTVTIAEKQVITAVGISNKTENFVSTLPFELKEADLDRGQERYGIYCTPCHGTMGDGKGKIWERGYLAPPNYHTDNSRGFDFYNVKIPLRDVPVGYIFEVITRGYGGMPDHASQIPLADRWRIAAYVQVLQASQNADLKKLPPDVQKEAETKMGGKK